MNSTELRRDLFLKGARSYLDAIIATQAFDRGVQDMCRGAYTRNAPALMSQMGLDPAEPDLYKYDEDAGEDGVALGISRPAQKGGCCFYVYLEWLPTEGDQPEVRAVIWLELSGRHVRDELYARLRGKTGTSHKFSNLGGGALVILRRSGWNALPPLLSGLFQRHHRYRVAREPETGSADGFDAGGVACGRLVNHGNARASGAGQRDFYLVVSLADEQ